MSADAIIEDETDNPVDPAPDGGISDSPAESQTNSDPQEEPTQTWREKMAGDDEKFLERLKRFHTEADFAKSYRELETKFSQAPKSLPDNPNEEELAKWRENQGIPATPDDYEIALSDGLVIGDEDKPFVDDFVKVMHEQNAKPEQVNKVLDWYYQSQEKEQAKALEEAKVRASEARTELREKWGPEFAANEGLIKAWIERKGSFGEKLANAKDENGQSLLSDIDFIDSLVSEIRSTDPSATVVYDVEMSGSSVEDEIKKIQDVIKNDPQRYANDPKLQERMAKLATSRRK